VDKDLVTRAWEWFDFIKARFWNWLFDEACDFRRPQVIASFIGGYIFATAMPEIWFYATAVALALAAALVARCCLTPFSLSVRAGLAQVDSKSRLTRWPLAGCHCRTSSLPLRAGVSGLIEDHLNAGERNGGDLLADT
jgi:hypothetical protein